MREKNLFILCIQETKLHVFTDMICNAIWNDPNVDFSYLLSIGASGGLITLWDRKEVDVWMSFSFGHVLGIQGCFVKTGEHFTLFNVYAPCDHNRQQVLWQNIFVRLACLNDLNICLCGDFNAVRCMEERRSVGSVGISGGSALFNQLINDNFLVDLPLRGRSFTWYRGDGRSMSRLDRFLLSDRWCQTWPNCFQLASTRGLSDHCPIHLCIDIENWGPRPVRMLKCWENFQGYQSFVCEKWNYIQVEGWGGYVLKEKLKLIKFALKEWHQRHSKNLPARMSSLKDQITALVLKGEESVLVDDEIEELHGVSEELFSLSQINSSICWQQSRMQWLREGDANTKFFHNIMSSRSRQNAIPFFLVDSVLVEGVANVRSAVYNHIFHITFNSIMQIGLLWMRYSFVPYLVKTGQV